jgi:hypothetical protein
MLAPPVDHSQLSTQLARVGVASIYLVVGPLLVVEIAQDRSGAAAGERRPRLLLHLSHTETSARRNRARFISRRAIRPPEELA